MPLVTTPSDEIDRVPRTEAEEALLLRTRPDGWEYLLFAAVLDRRKGELEPKWREHVARHREPSEITMSEDEALDCLSTVFDEAIAITDQMMRYFTPQMQEPAFGKPGESGDPALIEGLSAGLVGGYGDLLDWSARLRANGVPERFRAIFDIASEYSDRPLREFRDFINRVVTDLDDLPAALREGRPVNLVLTLTLSGDDEVQEVYRHELDRVREEIAREASQVSEPADDELSVQDEAEEQVRREVARMRAEAELEGQPSHPGMKNTDDTPSKRGGLLGVFEGRRAKKAEKQYESELEVWKDQRDACADRLTLAETYQGEGAAAILLKSGEAVFAAISGAALVEDRAGRGSWEGRSSGVSIPIGSLGGRSIRYRTGASRGHFVQGAPVATAIDTGTLFVTNQRAIFQGAKQTRECRFDKLVGFQHTADGSTIFSVSNRQKPTTVYYGEQLSGWFDFRLDLALAHYRNELPTLVAQLEADLAAADAAKPALPAR
jgi:hypothetical protein